ncbi:MAG: SpaA isopeptide-forming pilin-related protein [Thermomicrobiales bacterium]
MCDDGAGDGNEAAGIIEISGIPTGTVEVVESTVPEGYAGAASQTVEITVEEPASLSFVNTRLTGAVTINKNDEAGDPLGGACFTIGDIAVCDNDDTDVNEAEGVIEVSGIPTGSVDITETSAPEGYAVAAPQSVEVVQDESALVTFVDALLTGSVQILKTDEAGEPLAGACFLVDGQEICDGAEGDESESDGVILVSEIEIGPIVVSETSAPEGYALAAEAQTVEILVDAIVDVTFVNPLAVGTVSIVKTDADGEPLGGACFAVGDLAVCDNQDGDTNPDEGAIEVTGVAVGAVEVRETSAPENYVADAEPQNLDVAENETVTATFVNTLSVGSLTITKTDDAGELLAGACFSVDGGENICDNDESDQNDADGVIGIANVPAGSWEVAESQAPEGYVAAEPQVVEILSGETTEVTFSNQLAVGTIRILKTADDSGEPLGGACFAIDGGEPVCDDAEGDSDSTAGTIAIEATVGEHTVSESQSPEGYDALTPPTTVTVELGETVDVPFVNTRFTGSLRITKTDNRSGDFLSGACFSIEGETSYGPVCDNNEGDANPADGVIVVQGIDPGVYTVTETTSPEGFALPEGPVAENMVIDGGSVADLAVENEPEGLSVRPTLPPAGRLAIASVDDEGNPIGGACFGLSGAADVGPVCDNDEADLDPESGTIEIATIPTGLYTLEETTAPDGFMASAPQSVEIALDELTSVEIVHSAGTAETGSLRIRTVDADANPVGGACFSWGSGSQCDNLSGDNDPAVGEILITGLVAGEYTVTGTEPPVGMILADSQTVTIESGQEATLEFAHEAAPTETGGLEFVLNDADENPVPGACVALSESTNLAEDLVFCDGGEEDTNPDPGVLVVENLPVGTYSVRQTSIQGAESAAVSGLSFKMQVEGAPTTLVELPEKTVQVKANIIVVVIIIIIIEPPQAGGLDVVKRSEDTNILQSGACFQVSGQGNDIEICDNDGLDANLTAGVVRFVNLAEGLYTVSETQSPPGYDPGEDSDVAIVGGLVTTITVRNPPSPDPVGDLTVLKVDPEGEPIPGTCFEVRQGLDVIAGPLCDEEDGDDDGSIVFADLEPGNYVLRETQAASTDYQPIADQPVVIVAGLNTEVPVVNSLKPGSILITKLDDEGNGPLAGACFGLDRGDGIEFEVCDQQTGDGDLEEGIILIANVPPGEYDLVETAAPAGFDPAPAMPITVNPATQLLLEVENTPSTPPAETGDLTVIKRNTKGEPLPGACFALRQGVVIKVAPRCDGDDGNLDGRISFADVGVGLYGIIETKKPSADYQTPPEKFVSITDGAQLEVVIVNVLKPGRIQITKVNQQDHPLANACFTVSPGYFAQKCTNGSGQVVFDNLPPGVYTVTETQAPYGYLPAPPVTNIVVDPGLTTPVKIVNQKAPPPPDAGSLRVIKFFCPLLGNVEELWSVYDSSDANQKTLAQTANCKKGDATFVLKPTTPGDLVSIKFVTGPDGIAHLTLPAGIYTLTELGTGVTTQVQVFVSQQTTVVVLNYVPKPEPKPAAINVFKFTCDAGFQGQFYLDFIGACGATENLTNNVTFRISGAANASGITGDGGQRGRTLFTQLPGGLYLLREETAGNGQVYMWCGLQLDSSEFGAIGSQIAFPLQLGQTMYCAAFNVPDQVTDTTGSIVVQKYSCELPQVKRPANFDWFAECGPQTTGTKFGLSELVDGVYVPRLTGLTNVNGILTFDGLKSGTYKLQEIGGDWCHAESDSVNATGDVMVRAGSRSNVWIFNCVPTVEPPNTGAGTTAGAPQSGAALPDDRTAASPSAALFVWPVLALVGLGARQRWNQRRAA